MKTEKKSVNQNGGKRLGAGRKKGAPNKLTAEAQAKAKASGILPLDYLLDVMRNNEDDKMRMNAAIAAAPYVHAKLASVELKGDSENPIAAKITIEYVRPK